MPKDVVSFMERVDPPKTILLFGSGSSLPSGAPSVNDLIAYLGTSFGQSSQGFSLAEIAELIERKYGDRKGLIDALRRKLKRLRPTGGLLSLSSYDWKSIYTTNYDALIEDVYLENGQSLKVYTTNFDFSMDTNPTDQRLYKLHGSIDKDVVDGSVSRIIVTSTDYRLTEEYREFLYKRLEADMAESTLVIIGHSLSDPDIRSTIRKAIELKKAALGSEKVVIFAFDKDEDRAILLEAEGLEVVFGSIDDFFHHLSNYVNKRTIKDSLISEGFELPLRLKPSSIDVEHATNYLPANFSRMFNGGSASYSDIAKGLTFPREITEHIGRNLLNAERPIAVLVGTSGVGKTTACRQLLCKLISSDFLCWEHKDEFSLDPTSWADVAKELQNRGLEGLLFVDNASVHMREVNILSDHLASMRPSPLKLLLASERVNWRPRVKNPSLFRHGNEYNISKLTNFEIDKLLELVDREPNIRKLIEKTFAGFSDQERRRRLISRCEADMFVCLKNIFASEKFDDIILREYAALPSDYQDVYRITAALESSGVRVHRQLIIRLLNIDVNNLSALLSNMIDIINEHVVDEKMGIYAWRGRHAVITSIIANYKFGDEAAWEQLFDKVIDCISPTYEIEIKSVRDMCNMDSGLARLTSKDTQNRLLRKMMSAVPGERIPRHRLIRNLIDATDFDQADTEIRIFENDFARDGPVSRYKVNLMVARATRTKGIMKEDRLVILQKAYELAVTAAKRFPNNVHVLAAFCDVGVEHYKITKEMHIYNEAINIMRRAEDEIGDPEISRTIARYERRLSSPTFEE